MVKNDRCEIADNVTIGWAAVIRSFAIICDGVVIGNDCLVDAHVLIQPGVMIGNDCKIHSHSVLCEGVTLEDEVFIGHNVIFCNEKHPEAVREEPWELKDEDRVLVKKGAKVGSGSVILPGVTIGENAEIGAGATVVDDVPDNGVVVSPKAVLIEHRYGNWGKFL